MEVKQDELSPVQKKALELAKKLERGEFQLVPVEDQPILVTPEVSNLGYALYGALESRLLGPAPLGHLLVVSLRTALYCGLLLGRAEIAEHDAEIAKALEAMKSETRNAESTQRNAE